MIYNSPKNVIVHWKFVKRGIDIIRPNPVKLEYGRNPGDLVEQAVLYWQKYLAYTEHLLRSGRAVGRWNVKRIRLKLGPRSEMNALEIPETRLRFTPVHYVHAMRKKYGKERKTVVSIFYCAFIPAPTNGKPGSRDLGRAGSGIEIVGGLHGCGRFVTVPAYRGSFDIAGGTLVVIRRDFF